MPKGMTILLTRTDFKDERTFEQLVMTGGIPFDIAEEAKDITFAVNYLKVVSKLDFPLEDPLEEEYNESS